MGCARKSLSVNVLMCSFCLMGSAKVNVAPSPRPSLVATNDPPIALALLAPLCKPKPWPFFFVVKPWLNSFVRFSAAIPIPLSMIAI